jgi:hypothetical protein
MRLIRGAGNLASTDKSMIWLVPEDGVEPSRF